MTPDLAEMLTWLRQQIESDRANAQDQHRTPTSGCCKKVLHRGYYPCDCGLPDDTIARCEAELAIIDEHALMHRMIGYLDEEREEAYEELEVCARCVPKHSHYRSRADVPAGPCRTIRHLAYGYRHRPGWKEGWAL